MPDAEGIQDFVYPIGMTGWMPPMGNYGAAHLDVIALMKGRRVVFDALAESGPCAPPCNKGAGQGLGR